MENNKPVICFLNSVKAWGGGEKWHYEMANALHEKGQKVHFIANKKGPLAAKLTSTNINTHNVSIGNLSFLNPFKIWRLKRLFEKEKTDCLIMNISVDVKSAGIAAKLAGVKRIIYRRGSAIPIKNSVLNRFLFKNILTDVIANSEETKKTINQNIDLFPTEKIKVIYNGLQITAETDNLKEKEPASTFIVGNAARLVAQKGQKYLIEIALELLKYTNDFKILIAGEGPLRAEMESKIEENKLQNHIILQGFSENIQVFMDSIHVFLLTSKWEGFGFVLAEAMLRKKPIIAWDSSSNSELVKHGKNGYLATPYNIKEFTEYILALKDDQEKRIKFGEYGYKLVSKHFSMEKSVTQLSRFLSLEKS